MQMLTQSTERFAKIQKEAPKDRRDFLVQVTKYQAAKHCKVTFGDHSVFCFIQGSLDFSVHFCLLCCGQLPLESEICMLCGMPDMDYR